MKIRDKKHLHNLCLGLIHSLVILIPFGMALFTVAYAIFNKNAKDSYSGQENITYTSISSINDFELGKTYYFNNTIGTYTSESTTNTGQIFYSNLQNIRTINNNFITYLEQGNNFRFYYSNTSLSFYVFDNQTQIGSASLPINSVLSFDFILVDFQVNDLNRNFSFLKLKSYSTYSYIDNAFEYGFQKTNDSFNEIDYSILDFNALELFDIDYSNNVYLTFVNNYIKYLLNMELVLFIPEILLIFFTLVKRLMFSLIDKTDERSY